MLKSTESKTKMQAIKLLCMLTLDLSSPMVVGSPPTVKSLTNFALVCCTQKKKKEMN